MRRTGENACGKGSRSRCSAGSYLIREQSDVIAHVKQALKDLLRLLLATGHGQVLDPQERAHQERIFVGQLTVVVGITPDETVTAPMSLDGRGGAEHAWVVRGQESDDEKAHNRRIERVVP